ncbi:hypothetical protein BC835DRAFT_1413712 [Cytidiella melzeri]|nr:hypothetical protein BC835DRAFT_1413712 [Cytidiella melzeri]
MVAASNSASDEPKKPLKGSGNIYRITIVHKSYWDKAVTTIEAPVGVNNPPIFGVLDVDDDMQVWEYDSFKQTIYNKKTGLYAYPETENPGARILVSKRGYPWDVEDQDGGYHSIGVQDTKLYWSLASGEDFTFVTLKKGKVDDDSWKWVFNRV